MSISALMPFVAPLCTGRTASCIGIGHGLDANHLVLLPSVNVFFLEDCSGAELSVEINGQKNNTETIPKDSVFI